MLRRQPFVEGFFWQADHATMLDAALKHFQVVKTSLLNRSYYRSELFFDLAKALVTIVVLTAVWKSVYADANLVAGYRFSQMVTYVCAATTLSLVFNLDINHYFYAAVLHGDIAIDLIRPVNYSLYCFSQQLGRVLYNLLFGGLPMFGCFLALQGIPPTANFDWLATIIVTILGFLNYYLFCHFCALWIFLTIDSWGIEYFRITVVRFFAGGFIPVSMFPEPLATINGFLPFQYMIYLPSAAFAGAVSPAELMSAVPVQILWIIVLWALDQSLWHIVLRRVAIHGG